MSQALSGYAENATSTKSARSSEYDVIAKVTRNLRNSATKSKSDFPAFAEALHVNQKLWTALAVDVADPANPLPEELKARIVYLADFTRSHTRRALAKKASVLPLLEVNMAVLRGLKKDSPKS